MLPNEKFALACLAYYEEQGLDIGPHNGEFAHCPLPKKEGDAGYYLLWEHHQQQGLLQSQDLGKKCFYPGHVKRWLLTCDYWPDNFFDLWDIYDEFQTAKPTEELIRKRRASRTAEEWLEIAKSGAQAFIEKTTPEQRKEISKKAVAARLSKSTPESRSEAAKKGRQNSLESTTFEQRSEWSKKARAKQLAKQSPEERKAIAERIWESRRRSGKTSNRKKNNG
jgi:hypothetical protein